MNPKTISNYRSPLMIACPIFRILGGVGRSTTPWARTLKKPLESYSASEENIVKSQNYSTTFTVDQTPEEAFAAINDVRGWWSGNIEGSTNKLGDEWTYRYKDVHYSKQKIAELVPGKKVVWLVLDSYLNFIEDKTEWNGTRITFEIG